MQMKELDDILTEAREFESHLQEKKEHLRHSLAAISQKLQAWSERLFSRTVFPTGHLIHSSQLKIEVHLSFCNDSSESYWLPDKGYDLVFKAQYSNQTSYEVGDC